MTVYVVTSGEYSDYCIDAIFSTKALAEEFSKQQSDSNGIDEWDVDSEVESNRREVWSCVIRLRDGEIAQLPRSAQVCCLPFRGAITAWCQYWNGDRSPHASVSSGVSAEHCIKVAAEARQLWLRCKDFPSDAERARFKELP